MGTIIESCGYIGTDDHEVMGAKNLYGELFDGAKPTAQVTGCNPLDVNYHQPDLQYIRLGDFNPPEDTWPFALVFLRYLNSIQSPRNDLA